MASGFDLYSPYARDVAARYGIPENLFLWQIGAESGWNPTAQAQGSSAYGIAQFIRGTAAQYGVNPADPYSSIDGAGRYMRDLYRQTGSWGEALRRYGTTGHTSSQRTRDQAAALLAGLDGSGPAAGPVAGPGEPGAWRRCREGGGSIAGCAVRAPVSSAAGFLAEWLGRIVIILVGLVLLAAALYLLKPAAQMMVEKVATP